MLSAACPPKIARTLERVTLSRRPASRTLRRSVRVKAEFELFGGDVSLIITISSYAELIGFL
jgi:hypothetical protein